MKRQVSLTQNRRGKKKMGNLFCMIFVAYPVHGMSHPAAVFFFSKSVFGRGLKLPNSEKFRKKVAHLCCSTLHLRTYLPYVLCPAPTVQRKRTSKCNPTNHPIAQISHIAHIAHLETDRTRKIWLNKNDTWAAFD